MKISPPVRHGSALVGVAGALLLSGCAADASSAQTAGPSAPPATAKASVPSPAPSEGAAGGAYKNGTYTAKGSYQTPETVERISVTVTVAADTVTAVTVTGDPQSAETVHYQGQFIRGISAQVVGRKLDEISVHRVAGSSLTSAGFNQALAAIRAEAKD